MAPSRSDRLAGVHVLIVDDNQDALDVLRGFLEHHGALVSSAPTPDDALDRLGRVRADLIITDLAMPGMTGEKLLTEIRRRAGGIAIPVIALTAYPQEFMQSAERFDGYLSKPFDPAKFFALVARLIGR